MTAEKVSTKSKVRVGVRRRDGNKEMSRNAETGRGDGNEAESGNKRGTGTGK